MGVSDGLGSLTLLSPTPPPPDREADSEEEEEEEQPDPKKPTTDEVKGGHGAPFPGVALRGGSPLLPPAL